MKLGMKVIFRYGGAPVTYHVSSISKRPNNTGNPVSLVLPCRIYIFSAAMEI